MPEEQTVPRTTLEAKSPFELRVSDGRALPEADVRTALATGDMGFLHSFTTGSTVDGPGVRVVAWTAGCMWRCLYCHNPDTWTMSNGIPVTIEKATDELRKYRHGLKAMSGGFTLSGGEPLMQHRFALKLFARREVDGHPHGARHERLLRRPALRPRPREHRSRAARHQDDGSGAASPPRRHGCLPDAGFRTAACGAPPPGLGSVRSGAGLDRRPGRDREDRRVRRRARQRRAGGRPAVPSDGEVQVEAARTGV